MAGIAGAGAATTQTGIQTANQGGHLLMPFPMPSPASMRTVQEQRSWTDEIRNPEDMFANGISNVLTAILVGMAAIYMLPTLIVVFNKRKEVKSGVILLNLFLGWSVIGWLVALILSLQSDTIVVYRDK